MKTNKRDNSWMLRSAESKVALGLGAVKPNTKRYTVNTRCNMIAMHALSLTVIALGSVLFMATLLHLFFGGK